MRCGFRRSNLARLSSLRDEEGTFIRLEIRGCRCAQPPANFCYPSGIKHEFPPGSAVGKRLPACSTPRPSQSLRDVPPESAFGARWVRTAVEFLLMECQLRGCDPPYFYLCGVEHILWIVNPQFPPRRPAWRQFTGGQPIAQVRKEENRQCQRDVTSEINPTRVSVPELNRHHHG